MIGLRFFWSIFKYPFIATIFISLISFYALLQLASQALLYEKELEKTLALKQPHLNFLYNDDQIQMDRLTQNEMIKKLVNTVGVEKIDAIEAYTQTKQNISLSYNGFQHSQYNGEVTIIGFFEHSKAVLNYALVTTLESPFVNDGFLPTPLELWYSIDNSFSAIINQTLNDAINKPINYSLSMKLKGHDQPLLISAILNDYSPSPIIYTSSKTANKIANHPDARTSGFFINLKTQSNLTEAKKALKEFAIKNNINATVETWLDANRTQNTLLLLLRWVVLGLTFVILLLLLLMVFTMLYYTILKKQPIIYQLWLLGLPITNSVTIFYLAGFLFAFLFTTTLFLLNPTTHLPNLYIYLTAGFLLFLVTALFLIRWILTTNYKISQ